MFILCVRCILVNDENGGGDDGDFLLLFLLSMFNIWHHKWRCIDTAVATLYWWMDVNNMSMFFFYLGVDWLHARLACNLMQVVGLDDGKDISLSLYATCNKWWIDGFNGVVFRGVDCLRRPFFRLDWFPSKISKKKYANVWLWACIRAYEYEFECDEFECF